MAINVSDYIKLRDKRIEEIEAQIDGLLEKAALEGRGKENGRITIGIPQGASRAEIDLLMPKYKESGWDDVQFVPAGQGKTNGIGSLEFISTRIKE